MGEIKVRFVVQVRQPVHMAHHGIALRNTDNQLIWAFATDHIDLEVGEQELCYTFPSIPVRPGAYSWQVSLYEEGDQLDVWDCLPAMIVATENFQHARDEWNGILNVPCGFVVQEGVKVAK
jgi:hypothetical protein